MIFYYTNYFSNYPLAISFFASFVLENMLERAKYHIFSFQNLSKYFFDSMKKVLKFLALLLVALLVVAAILPKTYKVSRSVSIKAPAAQIYPYLTDFKEWEKWSFWAKADPAQKVTLTGEPGKVGHVQSWDGPVNGKGSMTIAALEANKSVTTDLVFLDPSEMKAVAKIELNKANGETTVSWTNTGDLDYPVGRFFGLFLDSMIGKDFEAGLTNLKNLVEKK